MYDSILKNFQKCDLPVKKAIMENDGRCILVQDSKTNELLFGEAQYDKNEHHYYLKLPSGERRRLSYSNIETIFTNGQRH